MNHQQITRGDLGDLARKAMRFIEGALRERRPWLRGQKSYEVYDENAKLVGNGMCMVATWQLMFISIVKGR